MAGLWTVSIEKFPGVEFCLKDLAAHLSFSDVPIFRMGPCKFSGGFFSLWKSKDLLVEQLSTKTSVDFLFSVLVSFILIFSLVLARKHTHLCKDSV